MKRLLVLAFLACSAPRIVALQTRPSLQLKYAVVVTRHGVRSPTWTPERLNQYSTEPWPDWRVPPGNLTTHGRELMKLMGEFYRQYFAAQKLLGKPNCTDAQRTYFWADTDQRTLETARALAEAIVPGCPVEVHSAPAGQDDPLFDPIAAGVAKPDPERARTAVAERTGPKLDALVDKHRAAFDTLARVVNGDGKAAMSIFDQPMSLSAGQNGATLNGPLSTASTLTENLLLEYADGMSGKQFGWGRLSPSDLERIMSLHTTYADFMRRTPYLARARGSNLLSYVLKSMEKAASGTTARGSAAPAGNALVLISGHDTNLSNISGALRLSWHLPSYQPDDTPPGGALIFSVWQAAGTNRQYVRLQFVAQTLTQMHDAEKLSLAKPPATFNVAIPGCGTAAEEFACEWSSFQKIVEAAIDPAFVQH